MCVEDTYNLEMASQMDNDCEHCHMRGDIVCNISFYNIENKDNIKRIVAVFKEVLNIVCGYNNSCVCVALRKVDCESNVFFSKKSNYKCYQIYCKIIQFIDACLKRGTENSFAIIQLLNFNCLNSPVFEDYATYGHYFDYYKFADSIIDTKKYLYETC